MFALLYVVLIASCSNYHKFEIEQNKVFIVKKLNFESSTDDVYFVQVVKAPSINQPGVFIWSSENVNTKYNTNTVLNSHEEEFTQRKGLRFERVNLSFSLSSKGNIQFHIPNSTEVNKYSPRICDVLFNRIENAIAFNNESCNSVYGIGKIE